MKEIKDAFDSVMNDLCCINWSETDGSDVKKILVSAFKPYKNHKPELIKMFEDSTSINKLQKMMITEILKKM